MLNPRQRKFCEHYSNGDGPALAYQKAFKKTNPNVCAAAASRLLKRAEIQAELMRREEILEKVVTQKAGRKAQKEVGEVMTKLERMSYLTKIVKGELLIRRDRFFFDGKRGEVVSQQVEELPGHKDRIAAINELNKMDGSHQTNIDITSGGKSLPKLIVPALNADNS